MASSHKRKNQSNNSNNRCGPGLIVAGFAKMIMCILQFFGFIFLFFVGLGFMYCGAAFHFHPELYYPGLKHLRSLDAWDQQAECLTVPAFVVVLGMFFISRTFAFFGLLSDCEKRGSVPIVAVDSFDDCCFEEYEDDC